MPYQVNTDSPIYKSLSPEQQQQVQQMAASGNIPPSVDQLYSSLQQTKTQTQATQAQIPGIQAQSDISQVGALQKKAQLGLSTDLKQNRMTLPDAINKYTALGMSADDVFNQYLGESPWGTPNQSPQDLQKMGVTSKALGQIGTPGSFMDRWNTKNALQELRGLHDTWNSTSALAHLPFLGDKDASARAYQSQKQVVGEHLSSLVPGASNSQGSNKGFLDSLPNVGDVFAPGAAEGQFSKVEQALMQQKGYSYKDVGLAPRTSQQSQQSQGGRQSSAAPQAPAKGGDILQNGLNDILNMGVGGAKTGIDVMKNLSFLGNVADADPTGTVRDKLSKVGILPEQSNARIGLGMAGGIGKEYLHATGLVDKNGQLAQNGGDIVNNAKEHLLEHPVNTVADALPFLAATKAGMASGGVEGASADTAAAGATKAGTGVEGLPGTLQNILFNGKARTSIGDVRQGVLDKATKAGNTVKGDVIVSGLKDWSETAKMGNLVDARAIDDAVSQATKIYKGKTLTPKQLADAYGQIEKGYTKGGEPRSATAAYIDRGVQSVLSKQLEQVAPGWKDTSEAFAKNYKVQKSSLRTKVLPGAASAGLGLAGLDTLRHVLGL